MLHIVSGYMRSGTSMMVDALSAGGRASGLPVVWSRERDAAMNSKHGDEDFKPNESYREINLSEYDDMDFPRRYDGSLIKIMSWGLERMRYIPHRIVYMVRDPLEIAQSLETAFGQMPTVRVDGVLMRADQAPQQWAEWYWQSMKRTVVAAETRADCHSCVVLNYNDVLSNPNQLDRLKHWPVDIEEAKRIIDPRRKRIVA